MSKQANKLGSNPLVDNVMRQIVGQNLGQRSEEDSIEVLLKRLKEQGIKSITYRFPVKEIAEFDQMIMDLQKALGGKRINKNDAIRTGVNTVLEDWKKNKKKSVVFKVLDEWLKRTQRA